MQIQLTLTKFIKLINYKHISIILLYNRRFNKLKSHIPKTTAH